MGILKDMAGKKIGKLTVIDISPNHKKGRKIHWNCKCECGNNTVVSGDRLRSGGTRSCGCLRRTTPRTHGMCNTPTHKSWNTMIQRCTNQKHDKYPYYGGRGIKVCRRWLKFENFLMDMGERPESLTLDRIDNNKDYSPDNCRWSTRTEQSRNQRVRKDNITGTRGVGLVKKQAKYRVRIRVDGKEKHIGNFSTKWLAEKARKNAELKYWGTD